MKTNAKTAETTNIVLINKQDNMLEKMKHNITESWKNPASNIINTAMLLLEAESSLTRSDSVALTKYLKENNILSGSVISKLRQIARNTVLNEPTYAALYGKFLYPSWISKKDADLTERYIQEVKISSTSNIKDVQKILTSLKKRKIVSIEQNQ